VDEGCSKVKVVVTAMRKKRKVDVMVKGMTKISRVVGASDKFVEELAEMCVESGEVMTLPDLQKTSS
jgi:hypothetical protein